MSDDSEDRMAAVVEQHDEVRELREALTTATDILRAVVKHPNERYSDRINAFLAEHSSASEQTGWVNRLGSVVPLNSDYDYENDPEWRPILRASEQRNNQ